jgi:hypothetical protein
MSVVAEEDLDWWLASRIRQFRYRFWIDGLEAWIRGIGEPSFAQGAINRGLSVSEGAQAGVIQGLHLRVRLSYGDFRQQICRSDH